MLKPKHGKVHPHKVNSATEGSGEDEDGNALSGEWASKRSLTAAAMSTTTSAEAIPLTGGATTTTAAAAAASPAAPAAAAGGDGTDASPSATAKYSYMTNENAPVASRHWVPKEGGTKKPKSAALMKLKKGVGAVQATKRLEGKTQSIFDAMEKKKQEQLDSRSPLKKMGFWIWEKNFNPHGKVHVYWDVWILLLVIYSSLAEPFRSAYSKPSPMSYFDIAVDLSFYVDIFVNFFTGFDKGYEVVYDKVVQAKLYMGFWFWVDVLATIEWDMLIPFVIWNPCKLGQARFGAAAQPWNTGALICKPLFADEGAAAEQISTGPNSVGATFLRLTRLIKVLRLLKAGRLFNRLTAKWSVNSNVIAAFKFMLYIMIIAHLLASLFYLWPSFFTCKDQPNHSTQEWACIDSKGVELKPNLTNGYRQNDTVAFTEGCAEELHNYMVKYESVCGFFGCTDKEVAARNAYVPKLLRKETFMIDNSCLPHSWRAGSFVKEYDKSSKAETEITVEESTEWSKYTQSLYWSLTTMTTIGYGDRGPSIVQEVWFVMAAEILGLSFFALLLQAINDVNESLGLNEAENKETKNTIVGFMKYNNLDADLIRKAIEFMNFKANSSGGRSVAGGDERFEALSPSLLRELRIATLKPILLEVALFGHSEEVQEEKLDAHKLFSDIDEDKGGCLDRDEIQKLMTKFGMQMADADLDSAMKEMDPDGSNEIDFEEFFAWFHFRKHGRPVISQAPELFIDELAFHMTPHAYSPEDWCVEKGEYGNNLMVVLAGKADTFWERPQLNILIRSTNKEDREPIIGLSTCLDEPTWAHVKIETIAWKVQAKSFLDCVVISRHLLLKCLENWAAVPAKDGKPAVPGGQELLRSIAEFHYDLGGGIPEFHKKDDHKKHERHQTGATVKHLEETVQAMEARVGKKIAKLDSQVQEVKAIISDIITKL